MKSRIALFITVTLTLIMVAGCSHHRRPTACLVCVDFEPPLAIGTKYGTPSNNPGDVVLTTNGIPVSVHKFDFVGGGGTFNYATVEMPPALFGKNQVLNTNNINVGFDFGNIGFTPTEVQLEFLDLGGIENISVNGSPIFAGDLSNAPAQIGGVNIFVAVMPTTGGNMGIVTLKGPVKELKIGGQEFWIDNVCARR